MDYKNKYLKYKNKYLEFKNQYGGAYVELRENLTIQINSIILNEIQSGEKMKQLVIDILNKFSLTEDTDYTINIKKKLYISFVNKNETSIREYYNFINKELADKFKPTYLWFDEDTLDKDRKDIIKWNILFNIFCLVEKNSIISGFDRKSFYNSFTEFIDNHIHIITSGHNYNLTVYLLKSCDIHFTGLFNIGSDDNYWHFTKRIKNSNSSRKDRETHLTKKNFKEITLIILNYKSLDFDGKLFYLNLYYIILLYETDKNNIINENYKYFMDKYNRDNFTIDDYITCSYNKHGLSENVTHLLILRDIILYMINNKDNISNYYSFSKKVEELEEEIDNKNANIIKLGNDKTKNKKRIEDETINLVNLREEKKCEEEKILKITASSKNGLLEMVIYHNHM